MAEVVPGSVSSEGNSPPEIESSQAESRPRDLHVPNVVIGNERIGVFVPGLFAVYNFATPIVQRRGGMNLYRIISRSRSPSCAQ